MYYATLKEKQSLSINGNNPIILVSAPQFSQKNLWIKF